MVTGPTAGIGHEFAVQLAQRGYDLVLVARDRERLDAVAREVGVLGATAEILVADLSDRAQYAAVEARLREGVDLLVNNAGYGHKRPFLANSVDEETAMLDVLVTAVLRFTHVALTTMTARGGGGIVNVSSVAGELSGGSYSAAKAYVTRLSEWADHQYRDQGVHTMALLPGFTRTEFHERMNVSRSSAPAWMWLDAHELVRQALTDFDAGRTISVPSVRYKVLRGAARYTPAPLLSRLQRVGRR